MSKSSRRMSKTAQNLGQSTTTQQEEAVSEQQNEQQGDQHVDPSEGGNARQPQVQVEQQPPVPMEGNERSADPQAGSEEGSEDKRTDASGRELHPWETEPKRDSEQNAGE